MYIRARFIQIRMYALPCQSSGQKLVTSECVGLCASNLSRLCVCVCVLNAFHVYLNEVVYGGSSLKGYIQD